MSLDIVNGTGGGHHAPLKTPREWHNIVHWTPLIKSQDVNNRYLTRYLGLFSRKRQNAFIV